ncbi:MAG: DUF58 domain-containing protein [Magnetococcales bacterium]|nr:DUF58 domain-containing protein [Magnetococcales bacterium]
MNGATPLTGTSRPHAPLRTAGPDPVPGGWATRIVVSSLLGLRHAALGLPLDPVRARSGLSGPTRSVFKGRGIEFAESRPYQPGDEVRHMDWRVTARTGTPHTKIFHEDRERATLVWVDLRSALFFATRGMYKAVLAARGAALVAWGAALQGDPLGGLLFTDHRHREIRPTRGDQAVLQLIGLLAACAADASETGSESGGTLEESLVRLRRVTRPGSRLFLFSDFIQLGEREKVHLAQLARRNTLVLLFLHDPLERLLPPPGWYPVSDGVHQFVLDSHSAGRRRQYQEQFQHRREALAQFCHQHGICFLACSTEEDSVAVLQRGLGITLHTKTPHYDPTHPTT